MTVETKRKGKQKNTLLVGVKLGASSREVLTWALVKIARRGDHVIVVHILSSATDPEVCTKEQHNPNHHLASTFDAYTFDVYESFCRLKQVDLQVKVSHSASVKKVLVEEAKLYNATKVIVGSSRHNALGSPNALASYCVKRLPSSCSVLLVDNGKVVFEKDGTQSLTGTNSSRVGPLNASQQSVRKIPYDHLEKHFWNARNPSDTVVASSPFNRHPRGQGNIPVEMEVLKSCLPLKPVCLFCTSNVRTLGVEEMEDHEHEARYSDSASSCDSFRTVSSNPCHVSQREQTGISYVTRKEDGEATSDHVSQKAESPSGWPLLNCAIALNKIPSPRSAARELSVVEWALQLPDRRALMTAEVPLKTDITQEDESREEQHSLTQRLKHLCKSKTCKEFTYQELESATSGFSADTLIGKGGWSRVYRGDLPDGQSVAVKQLNCSPKAEQELLMEVEITTALQNKHVISLIGYCVEQQKHLLVYNYLCRGSLEDNLHGGKCKSMLPWTERLKVAVGVAEALHYLHEVCSRPVIHRDVKSSNILLSEGFEPQLSDFGLAKWASTTSSHITCSDVVGTFGYLAPEYFTYGKINEKTDVYSFGVVLLELITGRQPIYTTNPKGQESLVMWAKPLLADGSIKELADPLLEDAYDTNEMQRMILGAALCVRQASQFRPRMSQAMDILGLTLVYVMSYFMQILKLLRGEGDDLTYWAKTQLAMSKDIDELAEDEYGAISRSRDLQTHLTLAMLGVDDDVASVSSPDQSGDLLHANKSFEDYLCGRYSRSSSFD
eukprot:Gb_00853 [translate_table: standard]